MENSSNDLSSLLRNSLLLPWRGTRASFLLLGSSLRRKMRENGLGLSDNFPCYANPGSILLFLGTSLNGIICRNENSTVLMLKLSARPVL